MVLLFFFGAMLLYITFGCCFFETEDSVFFLCCFVFFFVAIFVGKFFEECRIPRFGHISLQDQNFCQLSEIFAFLWLTKCYLNAKWKISPVEPKEVLSGRKCTSWGSILKDFTWNLLFCIFFLRSFVFICVILRRVFLRPPWKEELLSQAEEVELSISCRQDHGDWLAFSGLNDVVGKLLLPCLLLHAMLTLDLSEVKWYA